MTLTFWMYQKKRINFEIYILIFCDLNIKLCKLYFLKINLRSFFNKIKLFIFLFIYFVLIFSTILFTSSSLKVKQNHLSFSLLWSYVKAYTFEETYIQCHTLSISNGYMSQWALNLVF